MKFNVCKVIPYRIRLKRIDEMFVNNTVVPDIMYRNDKFYGNNVFDVISIIAFETGELYNTDIPDYCIEKYGSMMKPDVLDKMHEFVGMIDDNEIDIISAKIYAKMLITELERIWHIKIARAMWLADKNTVKELYCDSESDYDNIKSYKTSKYILSDLSDDGILFAYPK